MSRIYKVNADLLINVSTYIEAEDEEEAKEKAVAAILSHDCEFQDPISGPTINWAEIHEDDGLE